MKSPLRIGIIGMGGFAAAHHDRVEKFEQEGLARLIATCDPHAAALSDAKAPFHFVQRGVRVFTDYLEMLAACGHDLDLLVVPTPIPMHAEMHRAGVEAGIPVYLEKPPTLDYLELEEMIACDATAERASLVGFNFIVEENRQSLKKRLLAGQFGKLKEAHLLAEWPRPTSYFRRNGWAGRLLSGDRRIILDSCFGNAMSHYVHNILFWAGRDGLYSWGQPQSVQAELYRAHEIEGADTFFLAATTSDDVVLRFALTHACRGKSRQIETLVCEDATIRFIVDQQIEIRRPGEHTEIIALQEFDALHANHMAYHRYLRGEASRPMTTLVDSRPFVALNSLAYVSSGEIIDFTSAEITTTSKDGHDYLSVAGLSTALEEFATHGRWPGIAKGWRESTHFLVHASDLSRVYDTITKISKASHTQEPAQFANAGTL